MGYYTGLTPLRDVLADLYPAAGIARVVVSEAGIAESTVDFGGSAVEFWKNILTTAQNNGEVQALINVARSHFPKNTALVEAERIFQETPVPQMVTPDRNTDGNSADAPQNSGNTSIQVETNNGMISAGKVSNAKVQNIGDISGSNNVVDLD